MRKIAILEIDSGCYAIKTTDFQDSDAVEYHWDSCTQTFYGEYQMATIDKRRFQRETFDFKEYSNIGEAINFILKRDTQMANERYSAMIARRRQTERVKDVITI